jgi:hypothetical protein
MIQGQKVIRFNWKAWKIRRYLRRLSRHLPSESPLDNSWPESPLFLKNTSLLLRKLHHRWRVSISLSLLSLQSLDVITTGTSIHCLPISGLLFSLS